MTLSVQQGHGVDESRQQRCQLRVFYFSNVHEEWRLDSDLGLEEPCFRGSLTVSAHANIVAASLGVEWPMTAVVS